MDLLDILKYDYLNNVFYIGSIKNYLLFYGLSKYDTPEYVRDIMVHDSLCHINNPFNIDENLDSKGYIINKYPVLYKNGKIVIDVKNE
jgi:hypothetical protein